MASIIQYKLDLAIDLIDTTTGNTVLQRDVTFLRNGVEVKPIARGGGKYVFINSGRENASFTVKVYGYEIAEFEVLYEELNEGLPMKQVFLIPLENTMQGEPVLTLSGNLPGLQKIEAVPYEQATRKLSSYDERKRIMTLFMQGANQTMDDAYYGLVHLDKMDYEPFEVLKNVKEQSYKIKAPLAEAFSTNSPIVRVIFGQVSSDGDYILRLRDSSSNLPVIIRYVVNGEQKFKVVDFHELEGVTLQ